jgi:glycine/D-amino acid oxidase-like deaminating enzyme
VPHDSDRHYRRRSLWLDLLDEPLTPRPALDGDSSADVAIVGGGMTGLWTAYYLSVARPGLRITLIERDIVGFGASGRNGGWASAGMAGRATTYLQHHGPDAITRAVQCTNESIDEIGRVVHTEGIGCGFSKQGTLTVVTSTPQHDRLVAGVESSRRLGTASEGERLLSADEVAQHARVAGAIGGMFTPHCAAVDPARLVRGLAATCERAGVRIVEQTAATRIERGAVHTALGVVRADTVPDHVWDAIGWRTGLTIGDRRHLFFYAQRTPDGRIAIGGRGAPYPLRRAMDPSREQNDAVRQRLMNVLRTHFPEAADAAITHHWGGTLAVPRDWSMGIQFDPTTRVGSAGGYSGHGVVAANISGRTLAHMVVGEPSELTTMPWVAHPPRRWEPEPLRWLASQAIVNTLRTADIHEDRTGRTAKRVRLIKRFLPSA